MAPPEDVEAELWKYNFLELYGMIIDNRFRVITNYPGILDQISKQTLSRDISCSLSVPATPAED